MEKERKITVAFLEILLATTVLASFASKATTTTITSIDPSNGPTYHVSADPIRIPGEGLNTSITLGIHEGSANTTYTLTINVTDPSGNSFINALLVTTNASGSGENTTKYYGDFPGAHTNLTGTYLMTVNETLATGNFTVGLTDRLEYGPTDTVYIRGSGYLQTNEHVWVNITLGADTVFWQNKTAVNGVVEATWAIPTDAKNGTYTVTLTNATTPGTIKALPDIQNFTVFVVEIDLIDPNSGPVGTEVRILGKIIEPNGSYQILWDGKNVTPARPALGRTVNDTFMVPPSVLGNHTITLLDIFYGINSTRSFEVDKTTYYVFAKPDWVQEGLDTNITVGLYGGEANATYDFTINVTDSRAESFNVSISFRTDENGSGNETKSYLKDFDGANTDFVGTYNIEVNKTLVKGNFTVGLTDKPTYRREEIVSIRGSVYQPNENVTINIEFGGESVAGYPKINVTADEEGVVTDYCLIPLGAESGTYTVTITNATTPGTVKEPADAQNFTIPGVVCQIQTRNLDNETVADLWVQVYDPTRPEWPDPFLAYGTNKTGWVRFPLETSNYTFRALWRQEVVVGSLGNQSVAEDCVLVLPCQLAHIKIAIKDEATPPNPLSFINVTLTYNYITYYDVPRSETESFETNASGIAIVSNTLINISYAIEARRFDHLFNRTLIENLTASRWINITCPTYTLFVHVLDANELPIHNVQVEVYEWSTWRSQGSKATNQSGSTDFFITFGRYKVSVSNYSAQLKRMVVINETVIDLVKENQWMLVHCRIFNLGLSVKVVDYFGQPIPNALVEIKREGVKIEDDLLTGSNGIAFLNNTIGGRYQISVRIRGRPCGTKALYLDESKEMVFKIDGYVVISRYPLETSQLITLIAMSLLVVTLGSALAYRKRPLIKGRKKPLDKVG